MRILLAVDGSKCSLQGVRNLIAHARWYRTKPRVELVNVQPVLPYEGRASHVLGAEQVQRYYREEGEKALARARKMLDAARIKYKAHVLIGPVAQTLTKQAKARRCDVILMGTHGRTLAGQLVLGSVALKVLQIARVPVQLVTGR
jgi:nucleotide-binding universal stress UspA family protein